MTLNQLIREYLNDIPGASQRGLEDAHDKITRLFCTEKRAPYYLGHAYAKFYYDESTPSEYLQQLGKNAQQEAAAKIAHLIPLDHDLLNRQIKASAWLVDFNGTAADSTLRADNARLRQALDECSAYAALLVPTRGSNDAEKRDRIIGIARTALNATKGTE